MRSSPLARLLPTALLCATLCWAHGAALAAEPNAPLAAAVSLPSDALVQQILSQNPAWQAQLAQAEADRSRAAQTRTGTAEWTPSASFGQRRYSGVSAGEPSTREWSAGLNRTVRLNARSQADMALSDAQLKTAQAQTRQQWRTLSLSLLQLHGDWLREWRTEGVWLAQIELAERQLAVAKRRQQLGDAARIDTTQLGAAMAQAYAQKNMASQRRMALARKLNSSFPGWPLPEGDGSADTWQDAAHALATVPSTLEPAQLQALVEAHPDVLASGTALAQAQALAQQADADRRPDPTVGVQVAQDRSGAERLLSVNLSWPIGGASRSLAHAAQLQQAQAVALQGQDSRRRVALDLQQAWQDTQDSALRWQWSRAASQQLDSVATSLEKGYTQLGEGQLSEVLQARRLAKDQALNTVQAECDTWLALWRWQIESGERWQAPAP